MAITVTNIFYMFWALNVYLLIWSYDINTIVISTLLWETWVTDLSLAQDHIKFYKLVKSRIQAQSPLNFRPVLPLVHTACWVFFLCTASMKNKVLSYGNSVLLLSQPYGRETQCPGLVVDLGSEQKLSLASFPLFASLMPGESFGVFE